MSRGVLFLSALLLLPTTLWAANDNAVLRSLAQADQQQRQQKNVNWNATLQHDRERGEAVRKLLKRGENRTANDYANAASILNHGAGAADFRLAAALAETALAFDPKNRELIRNRAVTWDRMLLAQNRPQWYGTQYSRPGNDKPYALDPVDDKVSDAERAELGLPTLVEMRKKIDKLNQEDPPASKPAPVAMSAAASAATFFLAKDQNTMIALIEKQPALGLFSFKLAEAGIGQALQAQSSVKLQTFAQSRNKADALAVVKGEKPFFEPMSSNDACFFNYNATVDAKRQLVLDVSYDCSVKPGPRIYCSGPEKSQAA
ncbi:MAG: hypothetical protein CFE39_03525 [Comamonadaceae bacterium PBBC2]|nr:MAG: hypothetical protein CFE39_03525 [Comamonadaceae bacterium PBBC2]